MLFFLNIKDNKIFTPQKRINSFAQEKTLGTKSLSTPLRIVLVSQCETTPRKICSGSIDCQAIV